MTLAYIYPTRDRAPGTSVLEHLVISPIWTRKVEIEGIRQSNPRLPIDSKIDRVLPNPVMLSISANIIRLFNFDSLGGCGRWCRLETIELLGIQTGSLTNAPEFARSFPTLYFSFYSWAYPRRRQETFSSFPFPDIQVGRPTDEVRSINTAHHH